MSECVSLSRPTWVLSVILRKEAPFHSGTRVTELFHRSQEFTTGPTLTEFTASTAPPGQKTGHQQISPCIVFASALNFALRVFFLKLSDLILSERLIRLAWTYQLSHSHNYHNYHFYATFSPFNHIFAISLYTTASAAVLAAAPRRCHCEADTTISGQSSTSHTMQYPWPYSHTAPLPLPTPPTQPTPHPPHPHTPPTFQVPQHHPVSPHPTLPAPQQPAFAAQPTVFPYGPQSMWTFVHPHQIPPQATHHPQAFPASYIVQQLQPPPSAHPTTATVMPPPPAPQQVTPTTTSAEPQWHTSQGVWQPYSVFPPVTPLSPHPSPQPQQAISDSPQEQPPPHDPAPQDPANPTPNTPLTVSQPSPSPATTPAPPTTVNPDPAAGGTTQTASPAQPSSHQPHASRRRHHQGRRKTDHHRHGRHRRRRRRAHRKRSRTTKHKGSSRRHRSPSTSTYSYSATPSRSRSRQPLDLRPNTDTSTADNLNTSATTYPLTPVHRRPPDFWRPTSHFQQLPPHQQLVTWLDFHAEQLDTPNRPQHHYIANLLLDSNIT